MPHSTDLLRRTAHQPPRLLVSVRNQDEAVLALRGGCDILDIKEPHHGSLGRASVTTMKQIVAATATEFPQVPVTAALGEAAETLSRDGTADSLQAGGGRMEPIPAGIHFVKLGPADLAAHTNWRQHLTMVRRQWEVAAQSSTHWVAVAYADWELANAPPPAAIIDEALAAGCRGVLFDTWQKAGRRLLDWLSISQLEEWSRVLHLSGTFLALAGSLRPQDLSALQPLQPDIVAVRGAVCTAQDRTQTVATHLVQQFRHTLHETWADALLCPETAAKRQG